MYSRGVFEFVSLERLTFQKTLDVIANKFSLREGSVEKFVSLTRKLRSEFDNDPTYGLAALGAPVAATSPSEKILGKDLSAIWRVSRTLT
jgi:hypothetical protein